MWAITILIGMVLFMLLIGTGAANLSILALENTEAAFFFFILGCLVGGMIAAFVVVRRLSPWKAGRERGPGD